MSSWHSLPLCCVEFFLCGRGEIDGLDAVKVETVYIQYVTSSTRISALDTGDLRISAQHLEGVGGCSVRCNHANLVFQVRVEGCKLETLGL